jgi:hypothetical protein
VLGALRETGGGAVMLTEAEIARATLDLVSRAVRRPAPQAVPTALTEPAA